MCHQRHGNAEDPFEDRRCHHVGGGAAGDDFASVDEHDAIGETSCESEIVKNDQDGHASVGDVT